MTKTTIINDLNQLENFINWLPPLRETECYYASLLARKKYHPSATSDKTQCVRFTASSKPSLLAKIKQLELANTSYVNKNGDSVHNDALALYMYVNPRDLVKASADLCKTLVDGLVRQQFSNPAYQALSAIQKSKGDSSCVVFDYDNVSVDEVKSYVKSKFTETYAFTFIKTRGGVHLVVDPALIEHDMKRSWHKYLLDLPGFDTSGDLMVPVPGCTQGGFTPYLLTGI